MTVLDEIAECGDVLGEVTSVVDDDELHLAPAQSADGVDVLDPDLDGPYSGGLACPAEAGVVAD